MENFEYIIWDFNGTILDDVETGIKSVNKLLGERGLPLLGGIEDYHKHFKFPIIDYYRSLGFDFDKESYEEIAPIWVEQYLINVKDATLRKGVEELLKAAEEAGIKQAVISATEIEMLKKQLKDLGVERYFCQVCGLDNIHAASKIDIAKNWRANVGGGRAIFIGDTSHDAETARAIGAECLLVEGGHQPRETLIGTGEKVFSSFSSVREYIGI